MSSSSTAAELSRLLDAGYGLALLNSFEEARGRRVVEEAAGLLGLPLSVWSVSGGGLPGGRPRPSKGFCAAS